MPRDVQREIAQVLKDNPVVLYMKGNRRMPMCGFSAQTVKVLEDMGTPFVEIDVLSDPEIRQGIKQYSDWPTIPQLYINGEFVGGCDIIMDLHQKDELRPLLQRVTLRV